MILPTQSAIRAVTDDSWIRGLHLGHLVEFEVYGQKMSGLVLRIASDNITIRIPIDQQSLDVRRFSVTGTATISLDGAAARVPVSSRSTGEFVRLQFIGPPEIIQRRRHLRVPISVPVQLTWQAQPDAPFSWATSRTVDISVGGLRISSARTVWPSIGAPVQVAVDLPRERIIEQATVLGKMPDYDLRLAFTSVSPPTRAAIEALVH